MSLFSRTVDLTLTDTTHASFEFTSQSLEQIVRGAVARFQKENPTRRVELATVAVDGTDKWTWLPHLDGWLHEQPLEVQRNILPGRREGLDGAEL